MMFEHNRYWLTNASIPISLIDSSDPLITANKTQENLVLVDIEINNRAIASIIPHGTIHHNSNHPLLNLNRGIIFPCFADIHTHLDKAHIWHRAPNPDGTFNQAINTVQNDANLNWNAEDIYQRMDFSLKCSYAHGTKAIRTHIDAFKDQGIISFSVFNEIQNNWKNKLNLQAVSLVSLDYYGTKEGEKLADIVASVKGSLGGVPHMNPDLAQQLDRVFNLAKYRHLNLDFHTDESLDINDHTLRHVAKAAIRNKFTGNIICGHCSSLSIQSPENIEITLNLVKEAGISIISLPMCNLYLQDRQTNRTPRYRGVTLLHELKAKHIPVAIASDNCRDPFYAFGDHDMLEVFIMAVRIAHLDHPYSNWCDTVTRTPADLMGLPKVGRIKVGLPADLILFKGRNFSELLARSQHNRIILHSGRKIDTTLPEYFIVNS